jgi:diketogulonate reductase-like aldo/keto reductase
MPEWKDYTSASKAVDGCLERLGIDYVDLMLIHSPRPFEDMFHPSGKTHNEENVEVWRALEDAYKAGKARAIGLSNFQIEDIENILKHSTITPMVNQILVNITHYPKALMTYCKEKGILIEAYSPNATGKLNGKDLESMAKKYQCSLPQLGNKFDLQLGCVVLPKTTHKEHMKSNMDLSFFTISEEDMEYLESIGQYEGWKGADSE